PCPLLSLLSRGLGTHFFSSRPFCWPRHLLFLLPPPSSWWSYLGAAAGGCVGIGEGAIVGSTNWVGVITGPSVGGGPAALLRAGGGIRPDAQEQCQHKRDRRRSQAQPGRRKRTTIA